MPNHEAPNHTQLPGIPFFDPYAWIGKSISTMGERLEETLGKNRELLEENARLRAVTETDELTGLPNRIALQHKISELSRDQAGRFAVFFGDLDGFKTVNDEQGHEAGNELLRKAADGLTRSLRTHRENPDMIGYAAYRLSGDEFVVLVPGVTQVEQVEGISDRILEIFYKNRIGISLAGTVHEPPETGQSTLMRADSLMYIQKGLRREERQQSELAELPESQQDRLYEIADEVEGIIGLKRFYGIFGSTNRP